jgi:hypothetical protein
VHATSHAVLALILSVAAVAQESRSTIAREFFVSPTRSEPLAQRVHVITGQVQSFDIVVGHSAPMIAEWRRWVRATGDAARSRAIEFFTTPPNWVQVTTALPVPVGGKVAAAGADPLQGLATGAEFTQVLVLGDDDLKVKALPFAAVLGKGSPTTIAALIRVLSSADPELRWRAALGLSWSAGTAAALEAVPALVERLNDKEVGVRAFAAAALARIAPRAPEIEAALNELRKSDDEVVFSLVAAVRHHLANERAKEPKSGASATSRPATRAR